MNILRICREPGVKYRLKFVHIHSKDIELFKQVAVEVDKAMLKAGYTDYAAYCEWLQRRLEFPD